MLKLEFYEVLYNSDQCEGRGHMKTVPHLAFTRQVDAAKHVGSPEYTSKYGVMGAPIGNYEQRLNYTVRRELAIYDSYEEYQASSIQAREEKIKAALSKLTKEEKELLGVEEL